MKRRTLHRLFLALFLVFLVACAWTLARCASIQSNETWSTTAYKSLKTAAIAYDTLMSSARDLCDQGMLSRDAKMKILETGLDFWGAYHSAVDLLEIYVKTGNSLDKMEYVDAWDQVQIAIENLRRHLAPFLKEVR